MTGRWFSPETLVSITNKTEHHDVTEILLKVALNIIALPLTVMIIKYTQLNKNNELTAISLQADMEIPVPSICFKAYSLPSELQSKSLHNKYKICIYSPSATSGLQY